MPKTKTLSRPVSVTDDVMTARSLGAVGVHLFQGRLTNSFLIQEAAPAVAVLLEGLLREGGERAHLRGAASAARTVGDLIAALWPGEGRDFRAASAAVNAVLRAGADTGGNALRFDPLLGGVPLGDEFLVRGVNRNIEVKAVAVLSVTGGTPEAPLVGFLIKRRMAFSPALPVEDVVRTLRVKGKLYVPAVDAKTGGRWIIRSVKDKSPDQVRDKLLRGGRISEEELAAYEQSDPIRDITLCSCNPFGTKRKEYDFLPRDLNILASLALVQATRHLGIKTGPLLEASNLCLKAHEAIMDRANRRERDSDLMFETSAGLIERAAPEMMDLYELPVFGRRASRHLGLDKDLPLRPLLVRPTETEDELSRRRAASLSSLFCGKNGRFAEAGVEFHVLRRDLRQDMKSPFPVIEAIQAAGGGSDGVVFVWRELAGGKLPNNRILEFECLLRGWPVQHMVDQGDKANAPKQPHVFQGVMTKFVRGTGFGVSGEIAIGLDVSRHSGINVPSMPMAMDANGATVCMMPENLPEDAAEKRPEEEVAAAIEWALRKGGARPIEHVLLLRDGLALEDYEEVAKHFSIPITVISVRKRLMAAFSKETPGKTRHLLLGRADGNRIRFGLNPSCTADGQVRWLHEAEVIRDPTGLGIDAIGRRIVNLARVNHTSDAGLASLPAPIAYADRMANAVLDMMLDEDLIRHVGQHHAELMADAGGVRDAIYATIRNFVMRHPQGWSWAV